MKQKKQDIFGLRTLLTLFAVMVLYAHSSFAAEVLTLDRALDIAMGNSPDIKRTELNLVRSTEMLNAREASLKSNFSLSLNPFSYDSNRTFDGLRNIWNTNETTRSSGTFRVTQPIKETDGELSLINTLSWQDSYSEFQDDRLKTYDNNLYIAYRQPIFTYNTTKMDLEELELDIENSRYNYAIQMLAMEQQVTQNFYNVYAAKMGLDIALEELKNSQESYTIQKNKVEAGLLPAEELYQAELNLATSQQTVQNRRVSVEDFLDSFKLLIGISIYDSIDVFTDITHEAIQVDINKALNNGLKTRMQLRQLENSIQEALNSVIQAAAQNEFRGDVTLTYGIIGTEEKVGEMFDNPTNRQGVGISFNIPLWDWGEKKARLKAAEANVSQANLSLEDERNNIIQAIRSAHRGLENLVIQIDIARQNIRNAQLTYNINLERYKNGDITSMDLSLVQNQLSTANMNEVQALINYKMEVLNLKILSLWDFENNVPVVPESIIN